MRAGDFLRKPRGVPHAFWAAGPQPAKVVEMVVPGALEEFFLPKASDIVRVARELYAY